MQNPLNMLPIQSNNENASHEHAPSNTHTVATFINNSHSEHKQDEQNEATSQESIPYERRQVCQDRRNAHIAGAHINKEEMLITSGIPPEFDRRKSDRDRRTTPSEEKHLKAIRKKSAKISKTFLKSIQQEIKEREREERRNNLQEADLRNLIKSGVPPEYEKRKES